MSGSRTDVFTVDPEFSWGRRRDVLLRIGPQYSRLGFLREHIMGLPQHCSLGLPENSFWCRCNVIGRGCGTLILASLQNRPLGLQNIVYGAAATSTGPPAQHNRLWSHQREEKICTMTVSRACFVQDGQNCRRMAFVPMCSSVKQASNKVELITAQRKIVCISW